MSATISLINKIKNSSLINGVSGLMRVKNEGKFLELSVESVIDALDELIIVYQESADNTADIINKLQQRYPTKIKSYFYPYEVYSHNLDSEALEKALNLPKDSPHLLASYYNYTLSKATYKYALKIDGDQIYDTSKLKRFCDAYRTTHKIKINLSRRLMASFFFGWYRLSYLVRRLNRKIELPIPPKFILKNYEAYVIEKITNDKNPVSFVGINLNYNPKSQSLGITAGNYNEGSFPPFNGVMDHLFFSITEQTYYVPVALKTNDEKYGNCIIERFVYDNYLKTKFGWSSTLLHGGFLWFHVAPLKRVKAVPLTVYDISNKLPYSLIKHSLSDSLFSSARFLYRVFWHTIVLDADMQDNLRRIKTIVANEYQP